ncbi:hypothetical protein [Photobacterium leiognathi]|uniref:hypothetical protein n=1 Tax=Photobacterium leiognathi TaxID=553611 RepID=UPI0027384F7A|nr:hypothetical protein [Photobacterium leiognathi]
MAMILTLLQHELFRDSLIQKVKSTLNKIHSVLADKFLDMSDESLMWLVKGSLQRVEGGFNDSNELENF